MKSLKQFVIGNYLAKTNSVFDRAKIELIYNFVLFYLINLFLFYGNLLSNHYYYHAAIITFAIIVLFFCFVALKKYESYTLAAKILIFQQTVTGIISYLIQESTMDFVGEFFIVVNILIAFFTLGKNYGLVITALWFLQLVHCLLNDLTGKKLILINIPDDQILPPAPFFVLVPFFLCIYIIYQFVKTRSLAEADIENQKRLIEQKNKEVLDSIHYAKRIQSSLITSEKYIEKNISKLKTK